MRDMLVVIDMQEGFMNEHTEHIILRIEELLKQRLFAEVVFTRFINADDSPFERQIEWSGMKESPDTDIVARLRPYAMKTFTKEVYSCFTEAFERHFRKQDIERVFFIGVDTNICVTKSAVDAFERRIPCYVLGHYCASHSGEQLHDFALENLEKFIGKKHVIHEPLRQHNTRYQ